MAIEIDFLRQLDKFQLAMKKKVHSQYQGSRETRQFGQGLVFKDFREYVPGDDFRFIDWTVYARTNKFFIRRFEEERNMVVHIIVDASASMNYGTKKYSKFDYSSMVGIGFSYMALRNNEKFNFNTFADELEILKARKGVDQLMSIVSTLNAKKPTGKSNFGHALEMYKKNIRSKSLIILISDFLYPIDEVREVLYRYKRSQVVVIQVLDPSEINVNLEGDVILRDSELNTTMRTFMSKRLIKRYSKGLDDHIFNLKELCDETDSVFISTTTDSPVFDVFYKILGG